MRYTQQVTRERLKTLMAEYGRVALGTYLAVFVLVLSGFALALWAGLSVESASSGAGVLGAAYLATKAVQPLRIFATLALTPVIARVLRKRAARKHTGAAPESAASGSADAATDQPERT